MKVLWISGRCEHPGDKTNTYYDMKVLLIINLQIKVASFVCVCDRVVREFVLWEVGIAARHALYTRGSVQGSSLVPSFMTKIRLNM